MTIYFLVSGLLRTFIDSLYPFICELSKIENVKLLLCTTDENEDSKFLSKTYIKQIEQIMTNPLCKVCIINTLEVSNELHLSKRESNTIHQWYKIYKLLNYLDDFSIQEDDILIRIRPDIRILETPKNLLDFLKSTIHSNAIYIPDGNDIYNPSLDTISNSINDQFAIGSYKLMKQYCSLYIHTNFKNIKRPIISEVLLYEYLESVSISIIRPKINYTLCLSECKMIAITGDSGVGKSTLTNALRFIFPFDSNMIIETDRYHKWERGNENWNSITHLNPEANYLEKLADDSYHLKVGNNVYQVDYDHSIGKFTDVKVIHPKNYVFLCGLHTLYKKEMRNTMDLKMYIHTEHSLKRVWKIQRDIKKRGYSFEKCLEIFNQRQIDYTLYILPQKEYADIVLNYYTDFILPEYFNSEYPCPPIYANFEISKQYSVYIESFMDNFILKKESIINTNRILYVLKKDIHKSELWSNLSESYKKYIKYDNLQDTYLGLLQILVILIMMESI
jgi:uridine kinase